MSHSVAKKLILFGLVSALVTDITIARADILPKDDPSKIFFPTDNPEGSKLYFPELWGTMTKPYPTNAWFGNVIMPDGNPITAYPYVMSANSISLSVGYNTSRILTSSGNAWMSAQGPILSFLAADEENHPLILKESIVSPLFNSPQSTPSLAVTLGWKNPDGDIKMAAPIVRGSPYATMFYNNAKAVLISPFVVDIDGGKEGIVSTRHTLTINDGPYKQTWVLYSKIPTAFKRTLGQAPTRSKLISTDTLGDNVWLRLALHTDVMDDRVLGAHIETGDTDDALDKSAQVIPLSAQVETTPSQGNADSEIINFKYDVLADEQNTSSPLLMTLLPHQQETLYQDKTAITQSLSPALQYRTMKGLASGIALTVSKDNTGKNSASVNMKEILPVVAFKDTTTLADSQVKALQKALLDDLNMKNGDGSSKLLNYKQWDKDAYWGGKELARAARLVVIADQINDIDHRNALLDSMKKYLETYWLGATPSINNCALGYDTTFGGIVEHCSDYGNGIYNDHHFHYGYFLYALAVIAKYDADPNPWIKKTIMGHFTPEQWAETLIRDYANPNNDDPFLPRLRMQDDFDGHSWAEGLWATGDGKNQESISESVNSYYGLALFGQAINNTDLANWGRFLLAREIRGAQHYWQIPHGSDVYAYKSKTGEEVGFEKNPNHLSVTIVWNGKADDTTFFGTNPEYRYGIIMMPFTQISKTLLAKPWIEQYYTENLKKLVFSLSDSSWKWIIAKGAIFGATSTADQNQIWNMALQSSPFTYDQGDSKTNTLYVMASAMSQPTPPPEDCNPPVMLPPVADANVSQPIGLKWNKPTGATVTQYEIANQTTKGTGKVDGNTYLYNDGSTIGNPGPFNYSLLSICGDKKSTPAVMTVNRQSTGNITYTVMVASVDKNTISTIPVGQKSAGNFIVKLQPNSTLTINSSHPRSCTIKIDINGRAQIPSVSGCAGVVYNYDQAHKVNYINLPATY